MARQPGKLDHDPGRRARRRRGGMAAGSVKTDETPASGSSACAYKVMDANTTEQVATGYTEEKMEVGASVLRAGGFKGAQGGLTLDGMVQRLVQIAGLGNRLEAQEIRRPGRASHQKEIRAIN